MSLLYTGFLCKISFEEKVLQLKIICAPFLLQMASTELTCIDSLDTVCPHRTFFTPSHLQGALHWAGNLLRGFPPSQQNNLYLPAPQHTLPFWLQAYLSWQLLRMQIPGLWVPYHLKDCLGAERPLDFSWAKREEQGREVNLANVIFFLQLKPEWSKDLTNTLIDLKVVHTWEREKLLLTSENWPGSKVDCGAFLMIVNNCTEHQPQTKPLHNCDESRWKQERFKIMSTHRQKQERKMTKYPLGLANGVASPSSPIIALAQNYFCLLDKIHQDTQS